MSVKFRGDPLQKDTRGLPYDFDPRKFYEYSSQLRHKQAHGLEGLLHKILPSSLFSSLAFAIDPFSQLKISLGKITPANRTRVRKVVSILQQRKLLRKIHNWNHTQGHVPPSIPGTYVNVDGTHLYSSPSENLASQEPIEWVSSDTTGRTRVIGSDNGELSLWKASIDSPGYTLHRRNVDKRFYTWNPSGYVFTSTQTESDTFVTPGARIPASTVNSLKSSEMALANKSLLDNALSMFKGILPTHRQYTLFRNVVELRDLPRGILQLRETIKHFSELFGALQVPADVRRLVTSLGTTSSDIPKEWLSYFFGWRQTYSDVLNLMASPQKIGRKIDLLIRRNGQPSTFRSKRIFSSGGVASSGFVYNGSYVETGTPIVSHSLTRETEIRMVVNTALQFPPIDLPSFRSSEFYRQLGVTPTFTDIYNLVPWTWLVDWFTGLGDYVDIIDNMNRDRNLINWGLITARVQGELRTTRRTQVTNVNVHGVNSDPVQYDNVITPYSQVSSLWYTLQLRKDISTLLDVNSVTDVTSLTPYQQSILGALISARTSFRR